jgi:beta-glucosidase
MQAIKIGLLIALSTTIPLSAQYKYPFEDPNLDSDARITNILSLMTLDEKIVALGTTTAVPRLAIPDAGGSEGLHGLVQRSLGGLGSQKPVPTTQFAPSRQVSAQAAHRVGPE